MHCLSSWPTVGLEQERELSAVGKRLTELHKKVLGWRAQNILSVTDWQA